jgi:protein-tyrosine phosphatase
MSQSELSNSQQARLDRFHCEQAVEIHCHLIPGVDDGPKDWEECIALARALVRDGTTHIIATPHQLGRYEGRNAAKEIRLGVQELQRSLDEMKIPLHVAAGGEIRLDPAIPKLLERDVVLTLGDAGKYLLLELPTQVSMGAGAVMRHLACTGVGVILAHAERYDSHRADPASAVAWVENGATIQVNAGSITGFNGEKVQHICFDWIRAGWVGLVASDAHSTGNRRPRMTEAIDVLAANFGESVARLLCIENPLRVLAADNLATPVPSESQPS